MVWGMVFDALGAISDIFGMDFDGFGDQRSLWRLREQNFLVCVRPIPGFCMLPLRLSVHISSIWEVAGVLLGVVGGRFGFDLGSKIEMITRTTGIQESMLSPAWEHGFSMVSD